MTDDLPADILAKVEAEVAAYRAKRLLIARNKLERKARKAARIASKPKPKYTTAEIVAIAQERRMRAFKMYESGMKYREIAAAIGSSPAAARRIVIIAGNKIGYWTRQS